MSSVKPSYLIALSLTIIFVIYIKVSNPYREFSRSEYWEAATLDSVAEVPDQALQPGNKNGPVLMWAAMGSSDPEIIKALVTRGADINESDGIFMGTPLTGAAGYSSNPEIIDTLIELGADVNKTVHNNETALMITAQYNHNPGISRTLVKHGAELDAANDQGKTALDLAKQSNNSIVVEELNQLLKKTMNHIS
ncbi:MAG: ankyrin repeat domain-containing protein [Gammaproteobacteria bacterium]|nr:ankyrin repeat domain-containing protein [Gammaproteobacteria bacterium]